MTPTGTRASLLPAFSDGHLAVHELPVAEERRIHEGAELPSEIPAFVRRPPMSRTLATAVTLLCAGTIVGVGVGLATKEVRRRAAAAAAESAQATAAPVEAAPSMADLVAPAAAPVLPAPRPVADVERELVPPAAPTKAPKAAAAPPPAPAPETLASTVPPAKEDAPAELPRKKAVAPAERTIEVKVGDARVMKSFTLASPPRVVVDLEGGKLPKAALEASDGGGEGSGDGIRRVRFGNPAPGVGRVVVEVEGGARPHDVHATVVAGTLTIAFR
jgi:hypothetical protein